jgi:hypothetical protein
MYEVQPWGVEPGYFGSSPDNIIVIENFIDLDDLKIIQDFCPAINEWNNEKESVYAEDGTCLYNADYWNDRQCSTEILERINNEVWHIIDKYINKMQSVIEDTFKCKTQKRPPVIMKWRPGTEQRPHADKQLNDGEPNAFPEYDLNSLFYYNDDFSGGELYYPQYDIEIRPKPGLAVAHPGDVNYLHGVRMVTEGFRYTTPSFYTVENFVD